MTFLLTLLRAAIITAVFAAGPVLAHEGHDHDAAPAPVGGAASPRTEATSGPFELVAILQGGELVIFLDRVDSNAPVIGATVTVETPRGSAAAVARDSVYRLAAPWATSGSHDLIFAVSAADETEILAATLHVAASASDPQPQGALPRELQRLGADNPVLIAAAGFITGVLAVLVAGRIRRRRAAALALAVVLASAGLARAHEGDNHADQAAVQPTRDLAQRLPDGTLFVPKPTQRLLEIRTTVAAQTSHRKTVELPGRIIPDPNASGFVQASVSGRLSPPPGGFPRLGSAVKVGDVLALVTPPFQAIDVSDMRQRAGELDQQISIVERRIARYEPLVTSGATARTILDEAVLELRGLRERRASLDRVRREPEHLVAPVSGVIAAANAVAGQIAETNAVVFQIVEPSRLWVEALTFAVMPRAQAATARTSDGRSLQLSFQGAGLTDRSQAIPVHFAIEGDVQGLRVGQLVTVLAETGDTVDGLAIPRASVLRGPNGQTIVFEHTAPERFTARVVRVEPLDGERVVVLAGLEAGKRVVVQGAELLNQIR